MVRMTTAEATVASLLAHGVDTIYALPGVHNDDLFDAMFKAGDKLRTVHTRHEQGAAYMALGAALGTNRPQAYAVGPGPGPANQRRGANPRVGDEGAGAGAHRENPGRRHRPRLRLAARNPGPERHPRAAVDWSARIRAPHEAPRLVAEAIRSMRMGRN